MAAQGQQQQYDQGQQQAPDAERRVRDYMLDSEEISYSLQFRPTGLVNWIKSLLGFGVTYWFITNQRVIEQTRVGGGFTFRDVTHEKIASIEYATKVSLPLIALGILLALGGLVSLVQGSAVLGLIMIILGAVLVGYAYWRQRQVLAIEASGGVTFALNISKGRKVDDFIWYLHAERTKQTG
jgi:hypothetical protein